MLLPKRLGKTFDQSLVIFLFLFVIYFFFIITSCSQLPPKPQGTVWIVDYPRGEVVGATFGGFNLDYTRHKEIRDQFNRLIYRKLVERKPLSTAHKFICFDPGTWDRFDAWVKEVQMIAERRCGL
jgi:hypothetical protein